MKLNSAEGRAGRRQRRWRAGRHSRRRSQRVHGPLSWFQRSQELLGRCEDGRRAQAAGTFKRPFSYILHYTHLNLRAKLKKHRGKHSDLGLDSVFLGITSKSQTAKEKLDKLYFIRIKYFHTSKDTIWKAKGEPSELEGIIVNHIPEKGLVSIICEGILPPNKSKKQLKMVKESEHTFLQRCPSGQ